MWDWFFCSIDAQYNMVCDIAINNITFPSCSCILKFQVPTCRLISFPKTLRYSLIPDL